MILQQIQSCGFQIAYKEVNSEQTKTILFIHGNSCSHRTWYKQFSGTEFKDYRLIAFDLPGHGASSDSADPANDYSPLRLGEILANAIKPLAGNDPFVLTGFSLGTNVVSEVLNHQMKPSGIILAAPSLLGKNYGLEKAFNLNASKVFFSDDSDKAVVSSFFENEILSGIKDDKTIHTEDFMKTRSPFRTSLLQSAALGKLSDEIQLLEQHGGPVMVMFGEKDSLLNTGYLDNPPFDLWKGNVVKIKDAGHYCHIDQPVVFNNLLGEYLKDVFK